MTTRPLLCLLVVIAARFAAAECIRAPLKDEFKSSRSVFVGQVVQSSAAGITFEVVEGFKGAVRGQRIAAYPRLGLDGYGISLTPGSLHLVFAHFDGEHLAFGDCGGFRLDDATLRQLRRRAWWWRLPFSRRTWR